MPLEDHVYAGQSFTEVFGEEQQATLREAFPHGVCDYSTPGKGFQTAVPWLTYQDARGNVVLGGEPMGPASVSVPFGPASAPGDTADPTLASTGAGTGLVAVPVLVGAVLAVLRRRDLLRAM